MKIDFTTTQLIVALATVAAAFMQDIAGDLDSLGVEPAVVSIISKALTALIGFGLILKTGK
jgi:hypothetical protein